MNYTAFAFIHYVDITNIINIMKPTIETEVVQVCTWNCAAHFLNLFRGSNRAHVGSKKSLQKHIFCIMQ